VVLISCPHCLSDDIKAWQSIPAILKAYSKSKTKPLVNKEDAAALVEDCLGFEQAVDGIPVLSMYEGKETRTGGIFGPKAMVSQCPVFPRTYILTRIS